MNLVEYLWQSYTTGMNPYCKCIFSTTSNYVFDISMEMILTGELTGCLSGLIIADLESSKSLSSVATLTIVAFIHGLLNVL